MNVPFYIAKRYLFSKSSNNAINIITLFATAGVILASMALFVVLAGFSGLKKFSTNFYNTADPDIKITAQTGKGFIFNDSIAQALTDKDIQAYSKIIQERAFFQYKDKEHVAYLYGVDENFNNVLRLDTTVIAGGQWLNSNSPYGVVPGYTLANKLNLRVDYITPLNVIVPKPGNTYDATNPENMVNTLRVKPVGVFQLLEEWDGQYIFAHLPVVQELLKYPLNKISGINIKLREQDDVNAVVKQLENRLGQSYKIQTRKQLNAVYYKMIRTENLVSYLIFTLVLIIALFNVIGTIIMLILDKKHNLKTMVSMGMRLPELQQIFILQGFLLSVLGMFIGIILGYILVWAQQQWVLFTINGYLPFPVALHWQNTLIVMITMLVLSFLASYMAGKRINKTLLT